MNINPAPKTVMTPARALGVLQAALPTAFTRQGLDLVAAQSAVETAHWSEMYGYNFGNVTPTAAELAAGANYFQHPQTGDMKYLAFSNPLKGAQKMTDWLQSHGLYTAAQAGDLDSYMAGLQAGSYLGTVGLVDGSGHTVSQDDYTNYRNAIASIMGQLSNVTPTPYTSGGAWWLAGLAALGLAGWHWRDELARAARVAITWGKDVLS
jgi:hypothetical protein